MLENNITLRNVQDYFSPVADKLGSTPTFNVTVLQAFGHKMACLVASAQQSISAF